MTVIIHIICIHHRVWLITWIVSATLQTTLKPLKRLFFICESWRPNVFFNLKSSSMSQWALFDSFEYLCYGSMTIGNIFYSYSAGIDFWRQNLTWRQILTTNVDPRTVRVIPMCKNHINYIFEMVLVPCTKATRCINNSSRLTTIMFL